MSVILLYLGIIIMIIGCIMIGYSFILSNNNKYERFERFLLGIGIPISCIGWLLMIFTIAFMLWK